MSSPPGSAGHVTCSSCGRQEIGSTPTGMIEHDPRRGAVWTCPECLRSNVRAIEAKLDREWW